jgi:hypothetical protein
MSGNDLHRGARIGTRIATIVSQSLVYTHTKLLDIKHKLAVMVFNTISNEISDEVHDTIGHIIRKLAGDLPESSDMKPMIDFLAHGRGQLKAISGSSTLSGSILWAIGAMVSNDLAPIVYAYINEDPHLAPDSGSAAQMAVVGAVSEGDARYAMGANGHGARWQDGFLEIARTYPAAADLLDMLRRNVISEGEFAAYAKKSGTPDNVIPLFLASQYLPLSYQDVALAYMRGAVSEGAYFEAAKKNGVSASDASTFLQSIGEPPDTTDLMEGLRRGFIDEGTVEKGIRQSRIRDEWIPFIQQLRYSPMSIADAVNAVVQGHMDYNTGASIAQQNGLEPGQFDTLYQTAGAPLSRTELNDLYNRGMVGSDVVVQGLRESRLKDKYVQDAFALRRRLLEPRSLGEAVNNGAMDHATAVRKAMESGFNADDAAYLVNAASNRKMQSYREKVISQAEKLYTDGAMNETQFTQLVVSMGHSDAEAQMIARSADLDREQRAFTSATNAIRSKLISRHIDKAGASSRLDAIGMQAVQRDYLLGIWELEESANTRELTTAQILKAVKNQIFTPDQGAERLIGMGYSVEDTTVLLEDI